jgi:hypothetical protein
MKSITGSQRKILEQLIFPESYATIMDETKLMRGEIRDDLMQMMHQGLIKAIGHKDQVLNKKNFFYDLDKVEDCFFQATHKGLKILKTGKLP